MTDHSLKTVQLTSDKRADIDDSFTKPDELGLVPSWSYSALKVYETCPYRSYIQKVKKVYEDAGPAAERGSRIHKLAEDYVQTKIDELPDELKKFAAQFEDLRKLYCEGKVEVEGKVEGEGEGEVVIVVVVVVVVVEEVVRVVVE